MNALNANGAEILKRTRIVLVIHLIRGDLFTGCFPMVVSGSITRGNVRPASRVNIKFGFIFIVRDLREYLLRRVVHFFPINYRLMYGTGRFFLRYGWVFSGAMDVRALLGFWVIGGNLNFAVTDVEGV